MTLAVIGGSGLYAMDDVRVVDEHRLETPYGTPSDAIVEADVDRCRVLFLPRHGSGHRLLPAEIPYAANIYALKQLGAKKVLSISAVGSLKEGLAPGMLVLTDQFIDRSVARRRTFFGEGVVGHVSLADPTCCALRAVTAKAAAASGIHHINGGTYLCIEGPQFSTRAESHMYRAWGADVIGMTNATEARLAREAGLCYGSACFVTDYDCWRPSGEEASVEAILEVLQANVAAGQALVKQTLTHLDDMADCTCAHAAAQAVVTNESAIPARRREALKLILEAPA